jgi:molybdate transport system permease protein
MLFGNQSWTGQWFIEHGIDLVFTWPAAVIACIVVGFPMMYRTVRGAFENIDANMLDAARTLGWGEGRIFLRIMMPLAWPSIAAGTVLAFARAMGEFGCTLFFAGNYAGITQTIPIAIYFDWMAGDTEAAIFWVGVVILLSFLVILFVNTYSSRTHKWKRPGGVPAGRGAKDRGAVGSARMKPAALEVGEDVPADDAGKSYGSEGR